MRVLHYEPGVGVKGLGRTRCLERASVLLGILPAVSTWPETHPHICPGVPHRPSCAHLAGGTSGPGPGPAPAAPCSGNGGQSPSQVLPGPLKPTADAGLPLLFPGHLPVPGGAGQDQQRPGVSRYPLIVPRSPSPWPTLFDENAVRLICLRIPTICPLGVGVGRGGRQESCGRLHGSRTSAGRGAQPAAAFLGG